MMQVAKRIPFDDPNVLNICRGLYVASNLIILGIYIFIKITVDKKKGMPTAFHCLLRFPGHDYKANRTLRQT